MRSCTRRIALLQSLRARAVNTITQRIEAQDLSPRSFSQYATEQKVWFYSSLTRARLNNRALDAAFDKLKLSFPLPDGGYREGALLYEALWFGNCSTEYIPDEVALAAAVG